jgi:hypothetical protein
MYLLVCAIIFAVVWLVLFLGASGDFLQKKAYADSTFMASVKILLVLALAITGRMRSRLAVYDAISGAASRAGGALAGSLGRQPSEKS